MKLKSSHIKTKEVLKWKGLHLLNFAASARSQKVRIFMQLKGITWQDHQINLLRMRIILIGLWGSIQDKSRS